MVMGVSHVFSLLLWICCCCLFLLRVVDSTSTAGSSSDKPHHSHHTHSNVRHYRHSSTSRNIYIDLGANNGDSVNAFVGRMTTEDIAYDGSKAVAGGWQALTSRPDNASTKLSTWHILAFEASDTYNVQLETVRRNLTDHKYVASVKMFNGTAITTYDGTITFIWDTMTKPDAGATTVAESRSANGHRVTVPCMDIVTLFKREHISIEDFVVVKMDVEGAEYDIVKRIITSGLYRYIDRLAVEWHHNAFYVLGAPNNPEDGNYKRDMAIHEKYKARYEGIKWMMEGLEDAPMMFDWGRR